MSKHIQVLDPHKLLSPIILMRGCPSTVTEPATILSERVRLVVELLLWNKTLINLANTLTSDNVSVSSGLFSTSCGVNVLGKQCSMLPLANKKGFFFSCIYEKGSLPLSNCALTLLGELLWQIFTLGWIPVASSKCIWHRAGAQAARRWKSTLHSTLSICCANWEASWLFHGYEGWLDLPEPLISRQLELQGLLQTFL